ncbi:MAG: hypothetical protein GY859_19435 [Desulfobacterales bacterium]|nr:hypothetical protein [Desulfobacterales bacterium]
MKEILDKIRLKEGEILESDLGGGPAPRTLAEKSRQLSREIEAVEKRISELTGTADPPAPDATPGVGAKTTTDAGSKTAPGPGAKAAPAGETPRRIAEKLEKYKETLKALEEAYRSRANQPPGEASPLDAEIAALEMEKSALEKQLRAHLPAEGYEDSKGLFGIHVVKPGDNIWNIHFQVLKAFFKSKGVVLSPLADEADEKGRSSGVGKLLKFSEAKVYIYNLRERKLDMNLHLIHPLSKIVIFDFAEYFTLLERIDNKNVHHIEYDGETLWIPPAR